jgi:hypothetical protein
MAQFGDRLLPENHPAVQMCERVVQRLGPVTGMEGVNWKVHVVAEDVPNAFVIPGGQIFVFTVPSLNPWRTTCIRIPFFATCGIADEIGDSTDCCE